MSHLPDTCKRLGCHDGRFLSRHHTCTCPPTPVEAPPEPEFKSKIQVIEESAAQAYDKEDRRWFYDQPLDHLTALWAIACVQGAAWDDEVYDALAERGWFEG